VDDCNIFQNGFDNVSIEHCDMEVNYVAHELAKIYFTSSNSYTWVNEPPSFIISKLANNEIVLSNQ
jgi:hypothetical protein